MPFKEPELTHFAAGDGENTLHCPACSGGYLHQTQVEIFNRGEDADTGNHVFVAGDHVQVDRDLKGNPSRRRQGLTIHFDCEGCTANVRMHVSQHKGNTCVSMEYEEQPAQQG